MSTYDQDENRTTGATSLQTDENGKGWLTWLLAGLAVVALAVLLFLVLGGDADVDVEGGDVDIEAPDVDVDVDAPDVDVQVPDVDVDVPSVDIEGGDVDVEGDADIDVTDADADADVEE